MTWWNKPGLCDRDGILCDGAVRSGKTMALCCGFFLWSMARFDGAVFALCGKTVSSLRRNVILQLGSWLGGLFSVTEHRQDNKLTVRLGDRVNTYYLFGGQDESSYMLIQGITLAGVLLDEVVLMPRSFVEQAVARCSVEGSKLWFSCNPEGPEHWFCREWVNKAAQKNMLHLHFTMKDNPGLSPAVRQRYDRLYTGIFYRRYVLGQWCKAEGLVYDFDETRHICAQPPKQGRWYISVDYGTHNPFSAGLWCVTTESECHCERPKGVKESAISDGGGTDSSHALGMTGGRTVGDAGPYICNDRRCDGDSSTPLRSAQNDRSGGSVAVRVKEFYHCGRDTGRCMTDADYCKALEALAGDKPVEYVVIDPSAASMIAALRRQGRFRVRRARNAVLPGIRLVASLLQQCRLRICPGCADTIREFSLYSWDDDLARDAPKKENDHAMDDIRYFAMTVMGRNN